MDDPDRPPIANILSAAVQQANDSVTEQIPEGGTTVTAAVILGDLAYIAHVGDSRAYRIREDRIERLTEDHSLLNQQIKKGVLSPEEAEDFAFRNVITRAVGTGESVQADIWSEPARTGDIFILCSDGLHGMLNDEEIHQIVKSCRPKWSKACVQLVEAANERGGTDNITAVIVSLEDKPTGTFLGRFLRK